MKKNGYIVPIITAAAAVVALIIIMATVSGDSSSVKKDDNKTTTSATEVASQETEETTTTTEEAVEGENPKNKKAAEELEKNAEKRVYLTFDDGPSANTDAVLDVLKKYDIKATFFDIMKEDEVEKKALKRCYDEGHTIAIHTVDHDYDHLYASLDNWIADVEGEQKYLEEVTGVKTYYYRFPGGSSNTIAAKRGTDIDDCIKWLNKNGFTYYDWNIDNEDSTGVKFTADQLADNVLDYMSDEGDYMVLLHDTNAKATTTESLPKIIETLQAKGFTFCQITDNTEYFQHRKYDQVGD